MVTVLAQPIMVPRPVGVPVPISIKSDGSVDVTTDLRDFIATNAGKTVVLQPNGIYRCDSELFWDAVTGISITCDPVRRATIKGEGYHPVIHTRGCVSFKASNIIIEGDAADPGVWNHTNEDGHGLHLDGGSNYLFDRILIKNVEGDGIYCAQDNVTPGSGMTIRDSRIESVKRMGIAVVAWAGVRAYNMEYHNIAWRAIDLEPDPNVSYQQTANDCVFVDAAITGWNGKWDPEGLVYSVPFYLGTPGSGGGNQPLCQDNKILRHTVADSVLAGLACRIDPLGTNRVKRLEFAYNVAAGTHNVLDGVGFVACVNADDIDVHHNAMDMNASGYAVGGTGSTGLTATGNTGLNLIGQVKP
jgi:hypothetical protein